MEDGPSFGGGGEYAIEEDCVEVRVELEVGASPLHDGDRAAAAAREAQIGHALAIPAKDRVHEDPAHGPEQLAASGRGGGAARTGP